MELWVFSVWMVMDLVLGVLPHGVTVTSSELKLCDGNRECVTELSDCNRPPSAVHKTLDVSCSYQEAADRSRSMSCSWTPGSGGHSESDSSLIFTSRSNVRLCSGIFYTAAVLNVTVRIRPDLMGPEIWSQPHSVALSDAVKPSQPVLSVLTSTEDSMDVWWRSSRDGSCRLRYRPGAARTWTQVPGSVSAGSDQDLTHRIKDLLPFTVYTVSVACRAQYGQWSDWSADVSGRTLDRAPSRPPQLGYRVQDSRTGGLLRLQLMWKAPDPREDGGRVLGYQVTSEPSGSVQNVSETTALLLVKEGNCGVAVTAFNTAGYGPAAHLSVDTQRQDAPPPPVRNLWISSFYPTEPALWVQWEVPITPSSSPPVGHFAVQWSSDTSPTSSRWLDGSTTSTVISDLDPDVSYRVSVVPVSVQQQCGRPRSLRAALQLGAQVEVVGLKVVNVTKTTASVMWEWQRAESGPMRVDGYRLRLRRLSERRHTLALSLWPDQSQHTFFNLTPSTEYSLVLLADNVSRSVVLVTTDLDRVSAAATATPLLLLAITAFIICFLSRAVSRLSSSPLVSSPRGSTVGQWLMDPSLQKPVDRTILDIADFQVTDVLGGKGVITVSEDRESEDDPIKDTPPLSVSRLLVPLSALRLEADYVSDAPQTAERQQLTVAVRPGRPVEAWSPWKQEDEQQTEGAVEHHSNDFLSNGGSGRRLTREYVATSEGGGGADMASGQMGVSRLVCETDYITNSCFQTAAALVGEKVKGLGGGRAPPGGGEQETEQMREFVGNKQPQGERV